MSWISKEVVFERLLLLFNHLVVPDSLRHHGLQHARLPYPSPSPEVCSSSCPLHWWCHPTVSSSITLFSFCPQSFLASGTFQMNQPFASGDQNTGASASSSVLPMSIQGWFPLRLTALISTLKSLLQHHSLKLSILWHSAFFTIQLSQPYVTTGKTIALSIQTFVSSVMSLLFNTLSRFVIAFLPRSNRLLIHGCSHCLQWFWSQIRGNLSLVPPFPLLFAVQ